MYLILTSSTSTQSDVSFIFRGWSDIDLNDTEKNAIVNAGLVIKKLNIEISIAYTSLLDRDYTALQIVLKNLGIIKTRKSYKLNDRHFGNLEGKNYKDLENTIGIEPLGRIVHSYDVKAPELEITDERFPGNDPKYKDILKFELPLSESLKDTKERVVEYFEDEISTFLRVGENVLVVASGNSLRAFVQHLENISDEDIMKLEIETGEVIVYDLDDELNIKHKDKYNV